MLMKLKDYKVWRELLLDELESHVDYANEDFYLALVSLKPAFTESPLTTPRKVVQRITQSLQARMFAMHSSLKEAYYEECAMNGDDVTVCGLGMFYATKEYGADRALTHYLRGEMPTQLLGVVESGDLNHLVQKAVDNGMDTKETYFVVIHWNTLADGQYDVHATNLDYAMTKAIV